MTLKEYFTMVQQYQGKSESQIETDWNILGNTASLADWGYYHLCWIVDGEHPWDFDTQQRVNQRYQKGWSTKDPYAIDYVGEPVPKRKERRILNA